MNFNFLTGHFSTQATTRAHIIFRFTIFFIQFPFLRLLLHKNEIDKEKRTSCQKKLRKRKQQKETS